MAGFITACKLYICIKMRGVAVEKQIQWVLSYVQGGLADIWKENMLEDLEGGLLEYKTVGEFLAEKKKEFRGSREDKHGNDTATAEDRVGVTQPICHGGR